MEHEHLLTFALMSTSKYVGNVEAESLLPAVYLAFCTFVSSLFVISSGSLNSDLCRRSSEACVNVCTAIRTETPPGLKPTTKHSQSRDTHQFYT